MKLCAGLGGGQFGLGQVDAGRRARYEAALADPARKELRFVRLGRERAAAAFLQAVSCA